MFEMNFQKVAKLFDELIGFIVMVNKFLRFEKQCTISQGDNCISLIIFLTIVYFAKLNSNFNFNYNLS